MSPSHSPPWPQPTSQQDSPSKRKRSRRHWRPDSSAASSKLSSRQLALPEEVDEAQERCQWTSGNEIVTCFPTTETTVAQGEWSAVVWNSRLPDFTQTDLVDLHLFRADSLREVLHYRNVQNPVGRAGLQTAMVNDSWWGDDGDKWDGSNLTYPFYWMVVRSDNGIRPSDLPQARFNAVQTTYADSVIASSMAAATSTDPLSGSGASATATPSSNRPSSTGDGSLAPGGGNSGFPNWAIAVIVVLGFLALAALCVLAFFIIRRARQREYDSNRNSMSSGTPMMANVQNNSQAPHSPLAPLLPVNQPASSSDHQHGPPGSVAHDGASTISRANSAGESAPFSGADAAIMADAFRQALRKPDFADRPVEEGDSPDSEDQRRRKEELLSRELAEEGRDLRSVSSSRGVRVETLSDSGDTIQDRYR